MTPILRAFLCLALAVFFSSLSFSQSQLFRSLSDGVNPSYAMRVKTAPDGHRYAAYTRNQDVYLIKTTSLGELVWAKSYDISGVDAVHGLSLANNQIILTGQTEGASPDPRDAFVLVLDSSGVTQDGYRFDRNGERDAFNGCLPLDDGFLLYGYGTLNGDFNLWLLRTDQQWNVSWEKSVASQHGGGNAHAVISTSDGGFLVTGGMEATATSGFDIFLWKITESGTTEWANTYGSDGPEGTTSALELANGDFLIGGNSFGLDNSVFRPQACLLRVDSSGQEIYTKINGRLSNVAGMEFSADGNVVYGGNEFSNPALYLPKFSLHKMKPDGTPLWYRFIGTNLQYDLRSIEIQPDGGLFAGGYSFDMWGTGLNDPVVALLDSAGRVGCTDSSYSPVVFDVIPNILPFTPVITGGHNRVQQLATISNESPDDSLFCCTQNFNMQFDWVESASNEISFFSQAPYAGLTYSWDFGDGLTSTDWNPVHVYIFERTYNVCLTITSTCGTQTECFPVTVTSVSNDPDLEAKIQVYPNPTSGLLKIQTTDLPSGKWQLLDIQGGVFEAGNLPAGNQNLQLDLTDLPAGMYFWKLETPQGVLVRKLIRK